jgi:hypothetical protein
MQYGLLLKPRVRKTGRLAALTKADRVALLKLLLNEGWKYLNELQCWLHHEYSVKVSLNTISRVLKKERWLRKVIKRIAQGRNSQLRELYYDDMRRFPADIIVFLDEAIFNKKTSWWTRGRAPIGQEPRYEGDL